MLRKGEYPDIIIFAKVVPLHKRDSKQTLTNYTVEPRLSTIIRSSLLVENQLVQELKHFFP